jgi:hypothetical protein
MDCVISHDLGIDKIKKFITINRHVKINEELLFPMLKVGQIIGERPVDYFW